MHRRKNGKMKLLIFSLIDASSRVASINRTLFQRFVDIFDKKKWFFGYPELYQYIATGLLLASPIGGSVSCLLAQRQKKSVTIGHCANVDPDRSVSMTSLKQLPVVLWEFVFKSDIVLLYCILNSGHEEI